MQMASERRIGAIFNILLASFSHSHVEPASLLVDLEPVDSCGAVTCCDML